MKTGLCIAGRRSLNVTHVCGTSLCFLCNYMRELPLGFSFVRIFTGSKFRLMLRNSPEFRFLEFSLAQNVVSISEITSNFRRTDSKLSKLFSSKFRENKTKVIEIRLHYFCTVHVLHMFAIKYHARYLMTCSVLV